MITDLKKYKRLFAFGCSFTCYIYPTWADLIHKSMNPDTKFYNFGKSGGGNLFIASRISEANKKFRFNEDDLVVVMWSTFARIDFYKTEVWHQPGGGESAGWITPGNIYTQDQLSKHTVKELEDFNFFLIRDLALIDTTTAYLDSLQCDTIKLMSVPFNYESVMNNVEEDKLYYKISDAYKDLNESYPISLFDFMNKGWSSTVRYNYTEIGAPNFIDYHPSPIEYYNFLLHHNLPVTDSYNYAHQSTEFLKNQNNTRRGIIDHFIECDDRINEAYRVLW